MSIDSDPAADTDPMEDRPAFLTISFDGEGEAARARVRLLWDSEPEICAHIVESLPLKVRAHHAIFSGSEIAALTPTLDRLEPRHASNHVEVGDLAYCYLFAADHDGVDEDFAEICWFYDSDSRPSMFAGPVEVSTFARLEEADEFFAVSRRMRLEGAKHIRLERW
jgi:hypothetical protein